eukprot:SAG22_NODE_2033_length_3106_cov_1.734952_1_plen_1010_part_01
MAEWSTKGPHRWARIAAVLMAVVQDPSSPAPGRGELSPKQLEAAKKHSYFRPDGQIDWQRMYAEAAVDGRRAKLTPEERQIFEQLEILGQDWHPNAAACKLKMFCATTGCQDVMPYPYELQTEVEAYLKRHRYVTASTRLTIEEELLILDGCDEAKMTPVVANRYKLIRASMAGETGKPVPVIYPNVVADLVQYDLVVDNTIFTFKTDKLGLKSLKTVVSGLSYTRPGGPEGFEGVEALSALNNWINNGVRMKGGKSDMSFVFFFELMTDTILIKLRKSDSTHALATLLMRLMPPEETQNQDLLMSALRVMGENPPICIEIPKYEDKKRLFGKADAWIKILTNIKETFETHKERIKVANANFAMYVPSETLDPPSKQALLQDRAHVAPRIVNYDQLDQQLRSFDADTGTGVDLSLTDEAIDFFRSQPLGPIEIGRFVTMQGRQEQGKADLAGVLPFSVGEHPASKSHVATSVIDRLTVDATFFATQQNGAKTPRLIGFLDADVASFIADPAGPAVKAAVQTVQKLLTVLVALQAQDYTNVLEGIDFVLAIVNCENLEAEGGGADTHEARKKAAFKLAMESGCETECWFELVVGMLLCTSGDADLMRLCPLIEGREAGVQRVLDLTVGVLLTANRLGHIMRCRQMCQDVLNLLGKLSGMSSEQAVQNAVGQNLGLKADTLATNISCERYFIGEDRHYDPRYLVFEFTYNMVFRQQQIRLIGRFMGAAGNGQSLCHQMIMGAGKTTVVGPVLALLLGDGVSLITQVVPNQLLDFSRGVMREKFNAVIQKPVYTFLFERSATISTVLSNKLVKARDSRAVVCSTPTAMKSFYLKFIEILATLETAKIKSRDEGESKAGKKKEKSVKGKMARLLRFQGVRAFDTDEILGMRKEVTVAAEIFELFSLGVLILDEVDMILHPLKSELNWPLGEKKPLDLTQNRAGFGLRWNIPYVLMDAILFGSCGKTTLDVSDSREATECLHKLKAVVEQGCDMKYLQKIPHVILLNRNFYMKEM